MNKIDNNFILEGIKMYNAWMVTLSSTILFRVELIRKDNYLSFLMVLWVRSIIPLCIYIMKSGGNSNPQQ
jgi:hypothetical protein